MQIHPITYRVVVRSNNTWDPATGLRPIIATCGHQHASTIAAYACRTQLNQLTHDLLDAPWYITQVEDDHGIAQNE